MKLPDKVSADEALDRDQTLALDPYYDVESLQEYVRATEIQLNRVMNGMITPIRFTLMMYDLNRLWFPERDEVKTPLPH